MNPTDAETLMLLAAHMLALGVACGIFVCMILLHRRARRLEQAAGKIAEPVAFRSTFCQRPTSWLAVRSATPEAVRSALGGHEFFISPQVNGWVIVTGPDLPTPDDDVDACFLFLLALSRKLGHVEFFHAEKFSNHHAWARVDDGCVTRAYAWTGETAWNQGIKTLPEIELGLKCFPYGSDAATIQDAESNFEKVPALAARWSLDPAEIKSHFVN